MIIIFVACNVLYDNHMCVVLFILQRASIKNIYSIEIMHVAFVSYCVLLKCESIILVDFIPLLFMSGTDVFL